MSDRDDTLLPTGATPVEHAIETVSRRIDAIPLPLRWIWDPWRCPAALLPWLAWALSVDQWQDQWPEATKRAVIAASPRVHRIKGTVSAVKAAARAVAGMAPVRLVEWFSPGGSGVPFTAHLDVDITDAAGTPDARPELARELIQAVAISAPLRCRVSVGLSGRPRTSLVAASRIRPPTVRALHGGDARYAPRLNSGVQAASHLRKPLTVARVTMDGAPVRPFAGGVRTASLMSKPLTVARLVLNGAPIRPFASGLRAAANIRTPATVARVAVSGA